MAYWRDYGGYPCSYWTREDLLPADSTCPERRDTEEVHTGEYDDMHVGEYDDMHVGEYDDMHVHIISGKWQYFM